jgi:hypothetical protein
MPAPPTSDPAAELAALAMAARAIAARADELSRQLRAERGAPVARKASRRKAPPPPPTVVQDEPPPSAEALARVRWAIHRAGC